MTNPALKRALAPSERRRAEDKLRTSEERLRFHIEKTPLGVIEWDEDFRVMSWNRSAERIFGYTAAEAQGRHASFILPASARALVDQVWNGLLSGQGGERSTNENTTREGRTVVCEWYNTRLTRSDGHMIGVASLVQDITERTRAEEALDRESRRSHIFLRNASDGVHILDVDGNVLEASDSFCEMLGYSREELIGANVSLWDVQWSPQELQQRITKQVAEKRHSLFKTRHRRRDGSVLDVEITGQGVELDGKVVLYNSARDITERTRVERELVDSEARFRSLVEQSITGIYIIQDGKFVYANPRLAEIFAYASAEEIIGRVPLSLVAENDRGIVAENLRRRIEGEAVNVAYEFSGLRKDGSVIDVGVQGSRATYRGRPAVIGLLQDISEKKRAQAEIQSYVMQVKNAIMSAVEVATTLSEMRDPYTAGHERRVAQIAVAIGAELGFDERRLEGLRVAGYLHDVGKMTIPAEILSKPVKLSKIEFQLIQGHAQASYDALKGVVFPWPVAQVALQHHERMDGSGYPQGLKGDAILLEARIMAVADVVEAMSSHRPYRAGLGLEKALAEIERGRATQYDPEAVDACLRLFREKHYQLPA